MILYKIPIIIHSKQKRKAQRFCFLKLIMCSVRVLQGVFPQLMLQLYFADVGSVLLYVQYDSTLKLYTFNSRWGAEMYK